MADTAGPPRAAVFVDFDNVFMALLRWDERAAYAFGERPDAWLAWLERDPQNGGARRRTLIRRCYLNPGRWIDFPFQGPVARYREQQELRNRTYFGEFRSAFVRAGFDVVDCPPVASLKNAADMKMALDIREALDHPTRFDEFVILSGDSDFLPALMRLRAHDRRVTILAQDTAKEAYLAAADEALGLVEFANQGMGTLPITAFELAAPPRERAVPQPRLPEPPRRAPDHAELRAGVIAWLREGLAKSPAGAVRLTSVGTAVLRAFPDLRETSYAGAGTLGRLIEEARDPQLALSGPPNRRWLYDPARGPAPADQPPGTEEQPDTGAAPPDETNRAGEHAATQDPARPEPDDGPPPSGEKEAAPAAGAAPEAAPSPPPPPPPEPEPAPPEPEPAPPLTRAERDALMSDAAAKVRDILWGRRDIKGFQLDLPVFSSAEIGFVLAGVARCSPFGPMQVPEVAARLAAEGAAQGVHVSAREVVAIIRWLLRGKASFRDPMPPEAAWRLAEALYDQLGRAVERVAAQRTTAPRPEERLSEAEWAALEAWAVSGLEPPAQ